jgi:L-alanine-DL-glutamate epimerase-like enolase superfamily enzyme
VNGLLTAPFALDDEGCLPVPDGPGLGITLDDEAVERLRYR